MNTATVSVTPLVTASEPVAPSSSPIARASTSPGSATAHDTLLDAIHRTGHFKHLMAAFKAANLAALLEGPDAYTLFAPDDRAFDRLARPMLNDLLKPENRPRLVALLKFHLVPGRLHLAGPSEPQAPLHSLTTLQGEELQISHAQSLRVNRARIIEPDLPASNGVVQVIDTVLFPSRA